MVKISPLAHQLRRLPSFRASQTRVL
jgi:hypothetical protein